MKNVNATKLEEDIENRRALLQLFHKLGGTSSIQPSFTVDAHEHTFTWGDLAADSTWSNYVIFGQAFEAKCIRMEIGKWIPGHNSNVGGQSGDGFMTTPRPP